MPTRKVNVTVDLNATRIRLAEGYNNIVTLLNDHTDKHRDICINTEYLQEQLEDLRRNIAIICFTYFKDNEEYASIDDQVPDFVEFNPNDY